MDVCYQCGSVSLDCFVYTISFYVLFLALGARGRLVRPLELPLGSEVASFSPLDISILLYTLKSIWIDCSVMRGLKATLWVHFIEKTTPRPLDVPQKINKHNTVY